MLNRTGRWWNRRRLWYHGTAPLRKVADRPHPITITLGLMSPILGLVALFMSIQSLRLSEAALNTSQQSMKVGQRAYLSITDTVLTIIPSKDLWKGTPGKLVVQLSLTGILHNLGNTPASIEKLDTVLAARV